MRQVLNDLTIRSIATELPQLDVWDARLPCFGVRVTRRGTKTFILKTANRRYSLGRYPYVSLKDARDEARKRIALKYLPAPALPARTLIERYIKARTPKRIDHQQAYSLDGVSTNMAESYFSRIRRGEMGHHHHISGPYLLRFAQEAAWREDNRRVPNGEQVHRVAKLALGRGKSVDWNGYKQRHVKTGE